MAAEEEVLAEVETVAAVYGTDCLVLNSFPPHLHISLKPRTADVSYEQFVEASIKIIASPQYPKEPPCIDLVDCKGLNEQRQKHLLSCIREKAHELSCCLMLVTLCEEAVEKLSAMNHPDGDCPLCLYPLVPEDQQNETFPFMKLMSCFHCFHSECIIRWWHWLQNTKETDSASSAGAAGRPTLNIENRKVFGLDDIRSIQPYSPTNDIGPTSIYLSQHSMESISEKLPYLVKKKRKEGEEFRRVSQLDWKIIEEACNKPFLASGLKFVPLPVMHGEDYICLGFLFGEKSRVAYISDVSRIPSSTEYVISESGAGQLDLLILDALYKTGSHNVHFCLPQSLETLKMLRPKQALLIGMTHQFDHHRDNEFLKDWSKREGIPVQFAHDGLRVPINL